MLLKALALFAIGGGQLGNTLDAIPNEGDWGAPPVTEDTFDEIERAGFKSVRLPTTWTHHFASEAPGYVVNATWMNRIETVVDRTLKKGFWVVINVHHDSWEWADFTQPEDLEARKTKFEKLWVQIADRFKSKSDKLIFEPLSEPAGGNSEANADQYNDANQRFVNVVRNSGGYNKDRLLTLLGLNANIQRTVDWFDEPTNASNYILHVHDYDPWETSWGRTRWGFADDKKQIEDTFIALQNHFKVPAMIGEWGLTSKTVESAAAWDYFGFFVRTSKKYQLVNQLWDNGGDHYDRINKIWRDPVKLDIVNTMKDVPNTMFVCPQIGAVWLKKGAALTQLEKEPGTNYVLSATGFNLTEAYFKKALKDNTTGLKDTLTIKSSRGIQLPLQIRLYEKPVISTTAIQETSTDTLLIPVAFNGATLAIVKAVRKDDWTVYYGDLQKARIN
ncbi:glycoside hydrolase [Choiromyces venosus 120613-1]|uniref:Glycoside hydrolase n=1 Tax=Choiromyces venosus 120613-1 TaxID=1336337 RepID=A0A3N4K4Y5_9PEZI|nr:glycoside hydrolase [Choiromyces venosus 120613-1]